MSKDTTDSKALDLNDVEMVFGTPGSLKGDVVPDVHIITNEKKNGREPKPAEADSEAVPSQPLLEPNRGRQKPPLAGPEIDDLEEPVVPPKGEKGPAPSAPFPGIDDGLLEPVDKKPSEKSGDESSREGSEGEKGKEGTHEDGVNTEDGKSTFGVGHGADETDFYYGDGYMGNGIHNRFGDDRPGSPMMPSIIPDVNTYQQKKNLAQGMMDLALLSANANQLRYVLESPISHPYYYPSLVFIACSIILQVAVGVGLIMNSRYNVKDEKDICKADKINNMTVLGIFLITIVNVFITSFSVATPNTGVVTVVQQAG